MTFVKSLARLLSVKYFEVALLVGSRRQNDYICK